MITALLLAACLAPPLFDMTGPTCPPERELVECGCSECFEWPPSVGNPNSVPPIPAATFYEVQRQDPDGTVRIVGSSLFRNRAPYYDDDGTLWPEVIATAWCFAYDVPFPVEGQTYLYKLRACTGMACSDWTTGFTVYTAAPYACYSGGVEIACYPGDPIARH